MQFEISKCKTLQIYKEKNRAQETIETFNNEILKNMESEETYKYLGF